MIIQHNIPALNTFRQMGINTTGTAKSLEKLSSGYKINRAGDDAAGLAISEKMRSQIKGLNRASANALDGISLIQAAEGALQETHSILQRMRELGVQAANDVNELGDRNSIQDEINQLKTELNRIANTTEFNKKTVLDGSLLTGQYATKMLSGTAVVAGAYINPEFAANQANEGTSVAGIYTVAVTQVGKYNLDTFQYDLTGLAAGDTLTTAISFDNSARSGGQVFAEAEIFAFTSVGDAAIDNATFINLLQESLIKAGVDKDYEITTSGNTISFKGLGVGTGWTPVTLTTVEGDNTGEAAALDTALVAIEGEDAEITITGIDPSTGEAISTADGVTVSTAPDAGQYINGVFTDLVEGEGSGLVFEIADLTKAGSTILQVVDGRNLTLQAGANTGRHQTIDVGIRSMSAASLGVDNIRVDNHLSSQAAVAAIDNAVQIVSTQRAQLGAVQNRLEHTIANIDTIAENLQDAESRIRDTDMAKEMMNFTKFSILNQAAQAMMAQANSLPQGVLQLLR